MHHIDAMVVIAVLDNRTGNGFNSIDHGRLYKQSPLHVIAISAATKQSRRTCIALV
jgi:hypothetical protein